MRKIFSVIITLVFLIGPAAPVSAAGPPGLDTAVSRAASYVRNNVRSPGVGSEWAVLGLARSSQNIPDRYFRSYFRAVERHVREQGGALDERRITEHSRVIIALTAAGFNPRDVAGFDLTLPLGDFERTIWQGVNGAIFALLALDSLDYPIQGQATREMYVAEILRQQQSDGGWALSGDAGDADITGMALQALAKYQNNPDVAAATERALSFLSRIQRSDGGFSSRFAGNQPTLESSVQVLVALTELGISMDDSRFIKNGNTVLGNVLSFQNRDGSFSHTQNNSESNLMATQQALYGLVAAQRAAAGKNSLYRMSDRAER